MKNIKLYSLLIALAVFFTACDDDEHKGDSPDFNENVGAITIVSDLSTVSWDLGQLATESVSYSVDVDGFGLTGVQSVSVQLIFTDSGRNPNIDPDGAPVDSVFAPIELTVLNSFPSTVSFSAAELVDIIGDSEIPSVDSLFIGDTFNFIFPITTDDGRVLTTALNSDLCNEPAQPSFGGCNVSIGVACAFVAADAVGTYTVTRHRFGDDFGLGDGAGTTREVVAGPGENQLTIVGGTFPNAGGEDLILNIDPVSGITTYGGPADALQFDGSIAGDGQYTDVAGITRSCLGTINLTSVVSACCIPNIFALTKN